MKQFIISLIVFITTAITVNAQNTTPTTSIAKNVGLYVFPSKGQDQATMDSDEMSCYKWAVQQSGYDPMNPTKVEATQVSTKSGKSMVKGAAGGAAAGAAIGAIAGDTGEGAAIGAIAGGLRGRMSNRKAAAAQQQQNNQQAAAQNKALEDNFKKAFSACMEGKGYTVE
ncbi:YMGG-like glycine zipper-containing protein [Flammeovirga sp. SubArs3]|uniref:YMGG-like glycine zipper-containing protein n=1 Tax=Flammeovirga sp. SubArs3 TaxID=2995316 RepID=UPI00248AA9F2|nr:YMGG-like glycine zipper-containing protein [Flammeovirga sp. SubArs3]